MSKLGKYEGIARLILLLVVLPMAVYRLSLNRTYNLWSDVRLGERLLDETETRGARLMTKNSALDTKDRIAGGGLLDSLGRTASDDCIEIIHYTPYRTQEGEDFALRTAEIVLSGKFIPLILILDRLERGLPDCRFLSTEFRTIRRGQQIHLHMTLIVQQLIGTL